MSYLNQIGNALGGWVDAGQTVVETLVEAAETAGAAAAPVAEAAAAAAKEAAADIADSVARKAAEANRKTDELYRDIVHHPKMNKLMSWSVALFVRPFENLLLQSPQQNIAEIKERAEFTYGNAKSDHEGLLALGREMAEQLYTESPATNIALTPYHIDRVVDTVQEQHLGSNVYNWVHNK